MPRTYDESDEDAMVGAAAERERLRAELTAETRRAEDAHGEAQRWALQVETLRAEKAELVAALREYIDYCSFPTEGEPTLIRIRERMRAALAKATATEAVNA